HPGRAARGRTGHGPDRVDPRRASQPGAQPLRAAGLQACRRPRRVRLDGVEPGRPSRAGEPAVTGRHDVSVFAGLRGGTFVMQLPGGATQDLERTAARDIGRPTSPQGELSNYGLTILGRMRTPLPQATYRL